MPFFDNLFSNITGFLLFLSNQIDTHLCLRRSMILVQKLYCKNTYCHSISVNNTTPI